MSMFKCIESLEENTAEVFLQVTSILLRLVDNVLHYPSNPKYRKLRLENKLISTVIMPSIGAMECLFEIGFQEGEDALLLPPESTSIEKLKRFREEIAKRRSKYLKDNNSTNNQTSQNKSSGNSERQSTPQPGAAATSQSRPATSRNSTSNSTQTQNPFLEKLRQHSAMVLQYEKEDTKRKALAVLPLIEINERVERRMRQHQQHALKSGQPINEDSLQETLFFTELLCWFKNDFFEWVNSPKCSQCDCDTSFVETSTTLIESIRVEVYKCGKCSAKLTFPRYNEAKTLLETRKGRCGEWANAFTAVVRALNWDARLVFDESDHAWTEVYFKSEGRWVHCDPCECALDKPLLYEKGWKKQLSYVIGFSCEDVQDVTWRYSANHSELLTRRRLCTEQQLVRTIEELNHLRQANLSSARKKALAKRTLIELVQLMLPASDTEGDTQGRQSGSLAWRLARAETSLAQSGAETCLGQEEKKAYVWTPTAEEVREKRMVITYCTGTDTYSRGPVEERVRGWRTRAFAAENIFRKEEKDWKTVYLCRTENSTEGRISWQVDLTGSELRVGDVEVQCPVTTYENGTVLWLLCSGDKCVRVSDGQMKTSELRGSANLTITATLKGGKGDVAWQHAQLFRQPSNATDTSFSLSLSFISP